MSKLNRKARRLSSRVNRLADRLIKTGYKIGSSGEFEGDSRREVRFRKTSRKAGAAAGYGNYKEAKATARYDKSLMKAGYKRKNNGN